MTRKKRILGRLGRLGSKAFVSLAALRQEARAEAASRLQRLAKGLRLVQREEFELALEMVKKARALQEDMLVRLKALEGDSGAKKPARRIASREAGLGKQQNESRPKRAKN